MNYENEQPSCYYRGCDCVVNIKHFESGEKSNLHKNNGRKRLIVESIKKTKKNQSNEDSQASV